MDRLQEVFLDRLQEVFLDRLQEVFLDRLQEVFLDRLQEILLDRRQKDMFLAWLQRWLVVRRQSELLELAADLVPGWREGRGGAWAQRDTSDQNLCGFGSL